MKAETQTNIVTPTFIAVLFTIAKRLKQLKRPSMDKRIKKNVYILRVEYYTAFKGKEILTDATTWIYLEDIMLNRMC